MTTNGDLDIFLVTLPGFEPVLFAEARAKGFRRARAVKGGVTISGGWPEAWRANLKIRGASRVLVRIGAFHAAHLSELDKRARKIAWTEVLRPGIPFRVEATCKSSRIYHSGAAAQRIERAIREETGAPASPDAAVSIRARIEADLCTLSVDTSGELLHKRGHKEAVNAAPMRETLAALFLGQCGFDGTFPVLDPMCGSGTFVIEAAEIAARLDPGRSRPFAFEQLATFDAEAWRQMRSKDISRTPAVKFYGSDRDPGAIRMSRENAARAGVTHLTQFRELGIGEITPPEGPPGLVIVNPPYGTRLGERARLAPLYRTLGTTLKARFQGWRIGLITTEVSLAKATGLPFAQPFGPIPHGGLKVMLYLTGALP